jgi:hypothetical protein
LGFTKTKHKLKDPEDDELGTFWIKEKNWFHFMD